MKTCEIFAASLFGALVAAAPLHKRDVVWVTETAVDIVTMPVTRTVWVGADEAKATSTTSVVHKQSFAHQHKHRPSSAAAAISSSSVYVAPTINSTSVYVAPTTSSTSVYVAPTTSSTSVYVAPTTSSTSVYVAPTTSPTSVYVAPTTSYTSAYVEPTTSSTTAYVAPTTSSVYGAPTTSSVYVAPTTSDAPTSTYVPPASTSSAPAATSSAASSYGSGSGMAASGTSYTGDLTYYATGSGACGWTSTADEHIVAISKDIFDAPEYFSGNPNLNPLCGRYVSITGTDGSQHQAKVVDRCLACLEADLDLSQDFFNIVTSNADGRAHNMSWTWV